MPHRPASLRSLLPWLAALCAAVVYGLTLAPGLGPGDSPELTTAAWQAGVSHPTGYPVYMLLGWLVTHAVPFGSVAWRMNLLSALAGAGAVGLVALLAQRVSRQPLIGVGVALLFAFSSTFWSQAVVAEVYTLHLFWVAAVLCCLLTWDRCGDRRWLWAVAVTYGFAFTHHLQCVLLAPALVYFGLTSRHRGQLWRELPRLAPLFLLPLAFYLYLPWAAHRNPPANWNDPSNWPNFLAHVSGKQYRDNLFQGGLPGVWQQLIRYAGPVSLTNLGHLRTQIPEWMLLLAPIGIFSLARGSRRLLGLTLLVYGVGVIYALNYRIGDIEVYYIVSHMVVYLWIGRGLSFLRAVVMRMARRRPTAGRRTSSAPRSAALVAAGALALVALGSNWTRSDRSRYTEPMDYAKRMLATLEPGAVVVGGGDQWYFPLIYAHYVEGVRPDIAIVGFYDTLMPSRVRLVTRMTRQGVRATVPPDLKPLPGTRNWNPAILRSVLAENIAVRPVYLLGEPVKLWQKPWMQELVAPYRWISSSQVPLVRMQPGDPKATAPRTAGLPSDDPTRITSR